MSNLFVKLTVIIEKEQFFYLKVRQVLFFFDYKLFTNKKNIKFYIYLSLSSFFHKWTCSTFKINGSNIHVKSQYFTSKFISLQVKSHSKTSRKFSIWPTVATYRLSCSTGRCDPCRGTARHPVSSRPLCTRPTKCPRSPCIPSRGSPVDHTHTHPSRSPSTRTNALPVTKCTERVSTTFLDLLHPILFKRKLQQAFQVGSACLPRSFT